MTEQFLVSFISKTSENAESDWELGCKINAKDHKQALILARKTLKAEYPNFNFAKAWCWFVVGKPHRT